MTFAAVLCCVMTATVFTACGDDDTSYPATIMKCSRILKTQR